MENDATNIYLTKIKKLPRSQIELHVTISAAEFDARRGEAIKHIGAEIALPGFRKGHVPENIIVAKLGEAAILEEMAEIAIKKAYPTIIRESKLDTLGHPEIRITKIAMGNPLEFTLVTAIFPEIHLPDYKTLAGKEAGKKEPVSVTPDEVTNTINQIRRMRAASDHKKDADPKPTNDAELPPLTDAEVKTLGDFADVNDLTAKLRENMLKEKERAAKDKKRVAIIDAVLAKTDVDLPEIIITQELARMEDEFAHDVAKMGLTMDAYCKAAQKTKEELQNDWKPDAEKRAKIQLLVNKIAELEKIEPAPETLNKEVAALCMRYPDANKERAESYVRMLLTNEKVFELLESTNA